MPVSFSDEAQIYGYLVEVQFPAPVGTKRWTTREAPVTTTGANGAPAGTWTPAAGLKVSGLAQRVGRVDGEAVVELDNSDGSFTTYVVGTTSALDVVVTIWECLFNPSSFVSAKEQARALGVVAVPRRFRRGNSLLVEFRLKSVADPDGGFVPRREFTRNCSVPYGGVACGARVDLDLSCARTLQECARAQKPASVAGVAITRRRFTDATNIVRLDFGSSIGLATNDFITMTAGDDVTGIRFSGVRQVTAGQAGTVSFIEWTQVAAVANIDESTPGGNTWYLSKSAYGNLARFGGFPWLA